MKHKGLLMIVLLAAAAAYAGGEWQFALRPADASYVLYGQDLGDPAAPSRADSKVAFEVRGPGAREIFDSIGPDQKGVCTSDPDTAYRSRDGGRLVCTRHGKREYTCRFGFDLESGKSIGGSIC